MQTIVFIGSNKSGTSRDAIKAAEELGYFTVLLTDRDNFIKQRHEFPDVKEMIFVENLDKGNSKEQISLLQKQGKQICCCISFIDPNIHLAATLSAEMGLFQLSTDAIYKMEEKIRIRESLKQHPFNPFYKVLYQGEDIDEFVDRYKDNLPLILKPPVSNGSKDIVLAQTSNAFHQGLRNLQKKHRHMPILIEEYVIGPQYLIEVVSYKNTINIIAVIEQEISNDNKFIIIGYKYPAFIESDEYERLEETVITILKTLKFTDGVCHLEMRNKAGEWKLIEINPRMSGGAMNRIINEGTGINLVKEILKLHLGETPDFIKTKENHVYARFLTIASSGRLLKVTGKNRALEHDGVKEVYIKPRMGSFLTEPYSLGNRYAYIIASADTPERAERIALKAAKEIKFYMEPY